MKARWIRNAPDAMSALYETEGGPLPRYVAAFAEQDGTLTFYESDVDGGFKKVNALKGSGHTRTAEVSLTKLGYVVTKGSMTLWPDGHEHAVRLDRKEALTLAKQKAERSRALAQNAFMTACCALLDLGDVKAFKESFYFGALHLAYRDAANETIERIESAKYDANASKLVDDPLRVRLAGVEDHVNVSLGKLATVRIPLGEGITYRNRDNDLVRRADDAIDAYDRELDRCNAELAAKRHANEMGEWASKVAARVGVNVAPWGTGVEKLGPAFDHTANEREVIAREAARLTPPRPLWERALEAASPDAPQVNHCSDLWIGRGLAAFRFGEITIPMDMVGNRATWDEMAMEVYRAWLALKPGEQILNYIGRRSWRASTVVRPEVLP